MTTQGKLDEIMGGLLDAALLANVGDDSEHPATLSYLREVAQPWFGERGLLRREQRNAGAAHGFVAVRPKGKPNPEDWYAVLPLPALVELIQAVQAAR